MNIYDILEGELEKGSISVEKAKAIGTKIGVDFSKYSAKELAKGIRVEAEHSDTVGNDLEMFAKIAYDHLKEDPKYYTKLKTLDL